MRMKFFCLFVRSFVDTMFFQGLYGDWLPVEVDIRKFLETSKIPYISYFSFGERLAVWEQGTAE